MAPRLSLAGRERGALIQDCSIFGRSRRHAPCSAACGARHGALAMVHRQSASGADEDDVQSNRRVPGSTAPLRWQGRPEGRSRPTEFTAQLSKRPARHSRQAACLRRQQTSVRAPAFVRGQHALRYDPDTGPDEVRKMRVINRREAALYSRFRSAENCDSSGANIVACCGSRRPSATARSASQPFTCRVPFGTSMRAVLAECCEKVRRNAV